jgi:hypothetical protein
MAKNDTLTRLGPYAERLAENQYLQENLGEAMANLRAAYARVSKRKAKAAQDKRFYDNLRNAATALGESKAALVKGRKKPKRTKRRVVVVLVGGAAAAAAAAAATNGQLRARLLGQSQEPGPAEQ